MIRENEIIFNNPKIEAMIDDHVRSIKQYKEDFENWKKDYLKMSLLEHCEGMIGGYWYSLLSEAMMTRLSSDQWIDFTYDTIGRLTYPLTALYMLQRDHYTEEKNKELIGKTLAAVMYGLAMNEHNYKLKAEKGRKNPLWADGLNIYIVGRKRVDFLSPALQAVNSSLLFIQTGIMINMTPLIEAYKMATGIDLGQYGVGNIIISDTK